ncbi:hypothetical protein ABZ569_32350 [Streptomyces albus]|uniref:hypothetical protein n=1 Tax=Streptomyces albus TaxID=1888 RepID=UPI0033CDB6BB
MTDSNDPDGAPEPFDNLSDLFPPQDLGPMEAEARQRVLRSSGAAPPVPAPVEGIVVEQLSEEPAESAPRQPQLRQVIPATFTDPAVWQHRRRVATNAFAYHSVRTPLYAVRAGRAVAVGARVAAGDAWAKLWATEYRDGLHKARRANVSWTHHAELRAERAEIARANRRDTQTVLSATAGTSYVTVLVALAQVAGLVTASAALLPLVAWLYHVGARELRERAEEMGTVPFQVLETIRPDEHTPLTDDLINRALRTAGVLKDDQEIRLLQPIRAAEIKGTEALFKLPDGVTISKLHAKHEEIAAALDVEEDWLDIRPAGSPSRVSFWMTDQDPFAEHRPSPLLTHEGALDAVKDGIPASFDKRGQPVPLKLDELMMLIGGASRAGKGLVLRNLVCGAALDPRVRIRIATGKKPAEHSVYAPVLATYLHKHGRRLELLLDLVEKDIEDRSRKLARKGRSTPSDEDLDEMGIELLILDEGADYLDPNTPDEIKKQLAEDLTVRCDAIARAGAGVGVYLVIAIQDPKKGAIDTKLTANLLERWALRVADATAANAVLGSGSVGKGMRPQDIRRSQAPLGIRRGAEGEILTRAYMIDQNEKQEAEKIIARAVELRRQYGTLPGVHRDPIEEKLAELTGLTSVCGGPERLGDPGPAGDSVTEPEPERENVLDLLYAAFPITTEGEPVDRVPMATVRSYLAQRDPQMWGPLEGEEQSAYEVRVGKLLAAEIEGALEGTGARLIPRQVRMPDGKRPTGFHLREVEEARRAARNMANYPS